MIPKIITGFPKFGDRYIYEALYQTLIYLRPKYCLEIGTFHGYSAKIFQTYFNEYMPDGKLITMDIKQYVTLSEYPNVYPIIVHPYIKNSDKYHYVTKEEILEPTTNPLINLKILVTYMVKYGIDEDNELPLFDFCFLDGDHHQISAYNDFAIAKSVLKDPQYILFDDIDMPGHETVDVWNNDISKRDDINTYDYSDWNVWVGAALLWNKDKI